MLAGLGRRIRFVEVTWLLITFLVLKLSFAGILKECNRLILEQQLRERNMQLKASLARLEIDYHKGVIDMETYAKRQSEILQELESMPVQKDAADGGTSLDL